MSDLQDLIATQSIKAYNQGFNDAVGKADNILDEHKAGLIKMSALALQEGIKSERKRIIQLIEKHGIDQNNRPYFLDLIAKICEDQTCDDCESDCCG